MTISFGRRRLILTVAVAAPSQHQDNPLALDATDAELARLARDRSVDLDRVHWEGLRLMYGGVRRP